MEVPEEWKTSSMSTIHKEGSSKMTSKRFRVDKGLKQECCLLTALFKIYLEQGLKAWKRKCKGTSEVAQLESQDWKEIEIKRFKKLTYNNRGHLSCTTQMVWTHSENE